MFFITDIGRNLLFWPYLLGLIIFGSYFILSTWNAAKSCGEKFYDKEILISGLALYALFLIHFFIMFHIKNNYDGHYLFWAQSGVLGLSASMWVNIVIKNLNINIPANTQKRFLLKMPMLITLIFIAVSKLTIRPAEYLLFSATIILSLLFLRNFLCRKSCIWILIYLILILSGPMLKFLYPEYSVELIINSICNLILATSWLIWQRKIFVLENK